VEYLTLRVGLHESVPVRRAARSLSIDIDTLIGRLVRVWGWARQHCSWDEQTDTGWADAEPEDLDGIIGQDGFSETLAGLGWLDIDRDRGRVGFPEYSVYIARDIVRRTRNKERAASNRKRARTDPEACAHGARTESNACAHSAPHVSTHAQPKTKPCAPKERRGEKRKEEESPPAGGALDRDPTIGVEVDHNVAEVAKSGEITESGELWTSIRVGLAGAARVGHPNVSDSAIGQIVRAIRAGDPPWQVDGEPVDEQRAVAAVFEVLGEFIERDGKRPGVAQATAQVVGLLRRAREAGEYPEVWERGEAATTAGRVRVSGW